jgi:hypothetical protein
MRPRASWVTNAADSVREPMLGMGLTWLTPFSPGKHPIRTTYESRYPPMKPTTVAIATPLLTSSKA